MATVAERVTLSHHLRENPKTIFPPNVQQKPDIKEFNEHGVEFMDGSTETFTAVFYCTGYQYKFPFLSIECEISSEDNYVSPLYKHVININRPTMGFIGLPFYVCATQMFDLQSRFFVTFLSGAKTLPSKEEMLRQTEEEMTERWEKGLKKQKAHLMGPYQEKYYDDLSRMADIVPLKPVIMKLFNATATGCYDDFNNFRNRRYRIIDDHTFIKLD